MCTVAVRLTSSLPKFPRRGTCPRNWTLEMPRWSFGRRRPGNEGQEIGSRGSIAAAALLAYDPQMPTDTLRLSNHQVGNAGLYWVCYQLTLRGWNVVPTSRNARGVDLICYNEDASQKVTVQVKALSKRSPVPLGEHLNHLIADVVVVVRGIIAAPEAFLLTPAEVEAGVHRGEKDGKISLWLQPAAYEKPEYKGQWDKVRSRF